jgi:hypothetical protein
MGGLFESRGFSKKVRLILFGLCVSVRTALIVVPVAFANSKQAVFIYLWWLLAVLLYISYKLGDKDSRVWWPRTAHFCFYALAFCAATASLVLPFFHIVSILLAVDLCIGYICILQECPFATDPRTWW